MDGARLAYALGSPENDVLLPELAQLTDAFYIGGTKCGALLGEAVVVPNPKLVPHLFTLIKQRGGLLAKGRVIGIQFQTLFTAGLYEQLGAQACQQAHTLADLLVKAGLQLAFPVQTNQVFCVVANTRLGQLQQLMPVAVFGPAGPGQSLVRFTTSWATTPEQLAALAAALATLPPA